MANQLSESQWSELRICVHCRRSYDIVGDAVFGDGHCCLCRAEVYLTDIPERYRKAVLAAGLVVENQASEEPSKRCRACYLAFHSTDPFVVDMPSEPGWCSHCGAGGAVWPTPLKQEGAEEKNSKPEPEWPYFEMVRRAATPVPASKAPSMDDEDLRSVFSAARQAASLSDRVLLRLRDLAKAYQVTQGQEPTPLRYSLTDLAAAKSQLDYILSKKPKI